MPQKGQCSLDFCETDCAPHFDDMIISQMFVLQFCLVVLQLLWFGSWHEINNATLRHKCECSVRLSGTHFSAGGFWRRSWKISKTQVLVLKFALNYCHTKAAWHNLQCVEEHQNFSNSIYRRSVRKSIENLFYR